MPSRPTRFQWNAKRIAKIARDKNIQDRTQMSEALGLGRTTVYQAFNDDWSGVATMSVLCRMSDTFRVHSSDLVIEQWVLARGRKAA
jgi:hypothetical protein